MVAYTPCESEVSYDGQYPDVIEFEKPWDTSIQVAQGRGKISKEGTPLQSEGFGQCSGLILRNSSNLESALFHVDDFDLTHQQTSIVDELMRNYFQKLGVEPAERAELLAAMGDITQYRCPQNYGRMRRGKFQLRMQELNSDGIIQARFVRGDDSRDVKSRIVESLLGYLGVTVVSDLTVNTGRSHWDIVYKPNEERIYVNVRNQKKVLKYTF